MEAFPGAEMTVFDLHFLLESYQNQRVNKVQAIDEVQAMDEVARAQSFGAPRDTLAIEVPETALDFPGPSILRPALLMFALHYIESLVTWLSHFIM